MVELKNKEVEVKGKPTQATENMERKERIKQNKEESILVKKRMKQAKAEKKVQLKRLKENRKNAKMQMKAEKKKEQKSLRSGYTMKETAADQTQMGKNVNGGKKLKSTKRAKINSKKVISKNTMNLLVKKKSFVTMKNVVPLFLLIVLGATAIGKFMVYDLYENLESAKGELYSLKQDISEIDKQLENYEEIKSQYESFSHQVYTDEEKALVSRLDILTLIETVIMPVSTVESCAIHNEVANLTLNDITLDETVSLIQDIQSNALVVGTSLQLAVDQDSIVTQGQDKDIRVTLTIVFGNVSNSDVIEGGD